MSLPNIEQFSAAQKANAEVLSNLLRSAFNGMERLATLNMAASRDFFNTVAGNAQQFLTIKEPGDFSRINTNLAQPALDKWMEYSRSVYELVASLQKDVTGVLEGQYAQFSKSAAASADKAKTAPGGDVFAAAVKSVLDATTRTFDQMNAVAKQVSDIAEANMKVASTTAQAAGAATRAAAKKYSGFPHSQKALAVRRGFLLGAPSVESGDNGQTKCECRLVAFF
ncbi:MAG: phasin family protein [Zoogloeaceae bacterium]|jgi:phasin family protein|nr:phasin family protein [Zoogloeaceae bacterium]